MISEIYRSHRRRLIGTAAAVAVALGSGVFFHVAQADDQPGNESVVAAADLAEVILRDLSVYGTPAVGDQVSASYAIQQGAAAAIQWFLNGQAVNGATESSYHIQVADLGKQLHFTISATAEGYEPAFAVADPVTITSGAMAAKISAITGTPQVGQLISISTSTDQTACSSKNAPDAAATSGTVAWLRNGQVIEGEAGASYRLQPADAGQAITAQLSCVRPGYETASATSAAITAQLGD
ncbi:MAG: hypothetical protein LBL92_03840, partial [Propionibacteriaceae bacterium]|nr:hypothetical protein [Propionibacteriaceae bacterium]